MNRRWMPVDVDKRSFLCYCYLFSHPLSVFLSINIRFFLLSIKPNGNREQNRNNHFTSMRAAILAFVRNIQNEFNAKSTSTMLHNNRQWQWIATAGAKNEGEKNPTQQMISKSYFITYNRRCNAIVASMFASSSSTFFFMSAKWIVLCLSIPILLFLSSIYTYTSIHTLLHAHPSEHSHWLTHTHRNKCQDANERAKQTLWRGILYEEKKTRINRMNFFLFVCAPITPSLVLLFPFIDKNFFDFSISYVYTLLSLPFIYLLTWFLILFRRFSCVLAAHEPSETKFVLCRR